VNGNWCGTGGTNLSGCNIYNPPPAPGTSTPVSTTPPTCHR
jgi:hypothetical protein